MHYLVQENIFRDQHYSLLYEALERLELKYTVIRVFPHFDNKIVNMVDIPEVFDVEDLPNFKPDTNNVFVFGAVKLARIATNFGWTPGSFMNENHDFEVYSKYYKENLLNYDSIIQKVGDPIQWTAGEKKFIRPTKDTKFFTGAVFTENLWNESMENAKQNNPKFSTDTMIQVTGTKSIYKEIRFWVVGGIIVTGSQYKLGSQVLYDPLYDVDAKEFAQSMVDRYKISDSFVIDVCLTDNGWKIVECNCINCSGFYRADLQNLLIALEYNYNI